MRLSSSTFGRRLKSIRRDRGFTQAEVGEAIGKSKQTISAWENNLCEIRLGDAETCASALSCHLKDLLAPLDKPPPRRPSLWPRIRRPQRRRVVQDQPETQLAADGGDGRSRP